MIRHGMEELARFKKEHGITDPTEAQIADKACYQAWNDMFHKVRPEISYKMFKRVWDMCVERAAPPALAAPCVPTLPADIQVSLECLIVDCRADSKSTYRLEQIKIFLGCHFLLESTASNAGEAAQGAE